MELGTQPRVLGCLGVQLLGAQGEPLETLPVRGRVKQASAECLGHPPWPFLVSGPRQAPSLSPDTASAPPTETKDLATTPPLSGHFCWGAGRVLH